MRKTLIALSLFVICTAAPAAAQLGEWRVGGSILSFSSDLSSDPFLGTMTAFDADSGSVTASFEAHTMLSDAVGIHMSLTTAPVDFTGRGGDLDGADLAEIWVTPLILTLRYEFQFRGGIQPYIGAGLCASFFLGEEIDTGLEDLSVTGLEADPSIGWAAEAGLTYDLNPKTFLTLGVTFADVSTDFDLEGVDGAVLDSVAVEGSPVLIGLGFGWRF